MKRMLLALVLAAVACGAAAPSAQRGGFVPSGVRVGGLRVGGMAAEQARTAIRWSYNRPLRFTFYGRHWRVRPATVGADIDVSRTLSRALDAKPNQHLAPVVNVDERQVARYVRLLDDRLSVSAEDATAALTGRLTPVLHPAKPGLRIRTAATRRRLTAALMIASWRPVLRPAAHTIPATYTLANFGPVVVIHRGANRMSVYDGSRPWRTFAIATGQAIYPTPLGNWHVVDMQRDPWWRPPDSPWAKGLKPIPPGPGNPLGTRWMGLDAAGVGMHGTPDDASIGYSASHGCIRMHVPDAEWLFNEVRIGTPVFIVG
jgi:lipoprotein-anchoring transpeptidase ErfK/SrfK